MATSTLDLAPDPTRTRRWRRPAVLHGVAAPLACGWVVVVVVVGLFHSVLAPHDPVQQDLLNQYAPSSGEHWLGTDQFGRDVMSRLFQGAQVSLLAAAVAVGLAVAIGLPLGLFAGYRPGRPSAALGRINDAIMSMPPLLLALAVIGMLGPGLAKAMAAVGIIAAPRFFRVARASAAAIRSRTYIDAARMSGRGTFDILRRHVLPNAAGPLLVQITFTAGYAIVVEASLSFLGLGVQNPQASWGSMIKAAFDSLASDASGIYPPVVCVCLTILAVSVLGDALRDALSGSVDSQLDDRS